MIDFLGDRGLTPVSFHFPPVSVDEMPKQYYNK